MNKKVVLYLVLSILVIGCSLDKQSHEELPFIDASKEYSEKEINLTDFADVTYVYLNSKSDDYLFKGSISYITQNSIVVIDRSSQSILFFSNMDICMDAGKFQFISLYPYQKTGASPSPKYYMRDKETGEIFRQKITIPDYQGKDFYINPRLSNYYEKGYHFELDFTELKEAYNENKLNGKLKELVASLIKEDANNVFVFVDFHH